jgi:hypothetical protein
MATTEYDLLQSMLSTAAATGGHCVETTTMYTFGIDDNTETKRCSELISFRQRPTKTWAYLWNHVGSLAQRIYVVSPFVSLNELY